MLECFSSAWTHQSNRSAVSLNELFRSIAETLTSNLNKLCYWIRKQSMDTIRLIKHSINFKHDQTIQGHFWPIDQKRWKCQEFYYRHYNQIDLNSGSTTKPLGRVESEEVVNSEAWHRQHGEVCLMATSSLIIESNVFRSLLDFLVDCLICIVGVSWNIAFYYVCKNIK